MKPAKPREVWLNAIEANLSSSLGKEGRGEILFREVTPDTPAQKRVWLARAAVLAVIRRHWYIPAHDETVNAMLAAEAAERRERKEKKR